MLLGVGSGRWVVLACAFVGLTLSLSDGVAAPRAAELGPTAPFAEPSGGFVGQLRVAPAHGPVGTPITVTGDGFPTGQDLDLVWATVTGSWKVSTAEYFGREYRPAAKIKHDLLLEGARPIDKTLRDLLVGTGVDRIEHLGIGNCRSIP